MSKLIRRVFISLLLATLVTAWPGVGSSMAVGRSASRGPRSSSDLPRHCAGPLSGEPDSGGQGAPSLTGGQHAFSVVGTVNSWLLQAWYQAWLRHQAAKPGHH